MRGKWCKWGAVLLTVACLVSQTTVLAQQASVDKLKSQAPAMLQVSPGKGQAFNGAQLGQNLTAKRSGTPSGGMGTKSLPGEPKKPENAFYFLGLAYALMRDPQLRPKLQDYMHGAMKLVQAPQELHDLLTASAQGDRSKMQAFGDQMWKWVQSKGESATANFIGGLWTGDNFFALAQSKGYKLEMALNLKHFYAQTGPQQAVPLLDGVAGYIPKQEQLSPDDVKQLGGLFNQLADLLS